MKEPQAEPCAPSVSQDDINALATKLAKWSEGLPDDQRSVAMLIVEHARDLTPRSVALSKITADLRAAAKAVIESVNMNAGVLITGDARAWAKAWAKVGPIWQRRNLPRGAEDGGEEEIELLQNVFVNVTR